MAKNTHSTLLFCPTAISVHDDGYMPGQLIEVNMFLKGCHEGVKISVFYWKTL
jgi:hypothetical protein